MSNWAVGIVVAGVLALLFFASGGRASVPIPGNRRLTASEVYSLADQLRRRYYPGVSPLMLTAMAKIESDFDPSALNPADPSYGLMQMLYSTARDLYDNFGYRQYPLTSRDDLFDAQTSMYLGGAYVNWLSTWRGQTRGERFIVMSYNGGPGADNSQTRRHFERYQAAKAQLQSQGFV